MLVDLQIPVALELERKAAVFGELLEHVVEEADAGRDGDRCRGVEVHGDVNVGFLGGAPDRRAAFGELAQDRAPGFPLVPMAANQQSADAEIARELHVRLAITDHRAAGEVTLRTYSSTSLVFGLRQSQPSVL